MGLDHGLPRDDSQENHRALVFIWRITDYLCMVSVRFKRSWPTGWSNEWPGDAVWLNNQYCLTRSVICR